MRVKTRDFLGTNLGLYCSFYMHASRGLPGREAPGYAAMLERLPGWHAVLRGIVGQVRSGTAFHRDNVDFLVAIPVAREGDPVLVWT